MGTEQRSEAQPTQPGLSRRQVLRGAVLFGGALAASAVAACQAPVVPAVGTDDGAPQAEAGPVTLRVWGFGLDDTRAQARMEVFQTNHPDIEVEPVGGQLNTQQLLTAVASGDPPDVVSLERSQVGSWAGRNAIDPLDDLIERDNFDLGQYYDFTVGQVMYGDQVYGIPQFATIDLIYVNLDVLEEEGIDFDSIDTGDWEQLQMLGETLHRQEGDTVTRTGFDTKMQDGRLWLWSWSNGTELMSDDGQSANFNDPLAVEALAWAKETVDLQGGDQARAAFQQTQNFFSAQNPVLIGQTAMTVFENWLLGVLKVDPEANFRTLLPRVRGTDTPLSDGTGQALAVPRGIEGARRNGAWEFISGLTSTEAWIAGEEATFAQNQEEGVPYHPTITGNIAADQEAWNNIYQGIGPGFDQTVALWPEAVEAARFRYSGPVAAAVNDHMTAAVNDALQGVTTPEESLETLQEEVQTELDNFREGPGNR